MISTTFYLSAKGVTASFTVKVLPVNEFVVVGVPSDVIWAILVAICALASNSENFTLIAREKMIYLK